MNTSKFAGLYIVVFGSAALVATGHANVTPNDIDVIYGGVPRGDDVREEVERIVLGWATKWDIATTKLDVHFDGSDNEPTVPRPFDSEAPTVVIHGSANVRYRSYNGLASAIRAFGNDSDKLIDVLTLGQYPDCGVPVWEVSLQAARGISDNWQEDYCDGVEALRSALRHAAPGVWESVVKALPWLSFVKVLVRRGADLDGIEFASRRSSGGGARVFVGPEGVSMQYEHNAGEKFTIEQAIEKFVAPPVLLFNTTILTSSGTYTNDQITIGYAQSLVHGQDLVSAIGHDASAKALSLLLGIDVPVNRIPAVQRRHQKAICLKIRGRLPEGVILDDDKLREIGFDLFLLTRTA
jgi:hypothetical protein